MADVPKDIMEAGETVEVLRGLIEPFGPRLYPADHVVSRARRLIDALLSERERRTAQGVTEEAVDAACCAMAITIARQDGFVLTKAGYEHGKRERPEAHAQMVEYVTAGLLAAAPSLSTSAGGGE